MTDYTKVPQVWDAIVSMFKAALPSLDAVGGVFDGPPTTDLPNDYAVVGYDLSISGAGVVRPGLPSVTGVQDISLMGNEWTTETFDVHCHISSYSGDIDPSARRLNVLANLNLVAAKLATDRSLGGLIKPPGKATMGRFEWYVEQGPDMNGLAATVLFVVNCYLDPVM